MSRMGRENTAKAKGALKKGRKKTRFTHTGKTAKTCKEK